MKTLTPNQVNSVIQFAHSKLGETYGPETNCFGFIKMIYQDAGIDLDFNDQPLLSLDDLGKPESIGYVCFLKHKLYGYDARISHGAIIVSSTEVVHYAKYFRKPKGYKVYIATFKELFETYDFVPAEISPR